MSVSYGPEMVRSLQEKAARALPAEHVEHAGGWWLRHSTSCAWWAGTVLPHADGRTGTQGRGCGEVLRRAWHGREVPDQPAGVPRRSRDLLGKTRLPPGKPDVVAGGRDQVATPAR